MLSNNLENKIIKIMVPSKPQEPIFNNVNARAGSRQMQIPAKWTRADQSVHAQSYHSIYRSYTPD